MAIEDERFYKHDGVDFNAIVRAGIHNLESGETVQGGSTITQQLVRALYIKDPQRNFARKIREAKLASELEEKHTQDAGSSTNYLNDGALRDGRRPHRDRRRGRGRDLLRQARAASLTLARGRAARRACRRRPRSTTRSATRRPRSSAATRCSTRWSRTASSRARRRRGGQQAPLGLQAAARATPQRREPYFFDYVAGAADRAVRRRRLPPRRAQGPHHDQPRAPGRRARGDQQLRLRPGRARARRSSSVDPAQRRDQGDGLERHLPGPHVQPRRPGPPPAGLGVQDVRADRGDPQGRRPRQHLLRVQAAQHQRSRGTARGRSRPTTAPTAAR